MLLKTKTYPTKNPVWAHYTPNEFFESDILSIGALKMAYADFIPQWKMLNSVGGKNTWFEIRIVKSQAKVEISDRAAWWRQPEFMDKIFWVFQQPTPMVIDGHRLFCYVLEPFEGMRVAEVGLDKLGYPPFESDAPALFIPVDCTQVAWTETSNGFSDHGRPREEKVLTLEQQEKQEQTQEEVKKILNEIQDVGERADEIAGKII